MRRGWVIAGSSPGGGIFQTLFCVFVLLGRTPWGGRKNVELSTGRNRGVSKCHLNLTISAALSTLRKDLPFYFPGRKKKVLRLSVNIFILCVSPYEMDKCSYVKLIKMPHRMRTALDCASLNKYNGRCVICRRSRYSTGLHL